MLPLLKKNPKSSRSKFAPAKKNGYEFLAWQLDQTVCGIDEVGRGSLAGPVVAAAVILPKNCSYRLLKDSKMMTPEDRYKAACWIRRNCYYGYGIINHRLIDKHNIYHATLIAMRKAVMNLLATGQKPQSILIDAMPLNLNDSCYHDIPIYHFAFGEKRSTSIAAASILAKVKRDSIIEKMDKLFPHYAWNTNKSYSTREHKAALIKHNHTILHRLTYLARIDELNEQEVIDESKQQSFF